MPGLPIIFGHLKAVRAGPILPCSTLAGEPALVAELRGRGYEINEGMVLALDGRIFFGAEVTRMVALFGEAQPPPRRLLLFAIGAAPWSRRLYPWLNRGRQLLLRILGRGLIG